MKASLGTVQAVVMGCEAEDSREAAAEGARNQVTHKPQHHVERLGQDSSGHWEQVLTRECRGQIFKGLIPTSKSPRKPDTRLHAMLSPMPEMV